jgi:superfamily II DNA or RNA helicase
MPDGIREWQRLAVEAYKRKAQDDFLLVACPGAGKTRCGLLIADNLLQLGIVKRIVAVVHTVHLKTQWRDAAKDLELDLTAEWTTSLARPEASDYQGTIATYQQVASGSHAFRKHCQTPTLVIFDEIHHAGGEQKWASELRTAFENATRRLALSGTPFRTDNIEIPFVRYENNESVADSTYTYPDALSDGICRHIQFPSYEGIQEWYKDGQMHSATFGDKLPEDEARARLRTALSPSGDWIKAVFKDANKQLDEVRANGDPNAGGLVLAIDKWHAEKLQERLPGAELVTYDDPEASKTIGEFRNSTARWLIAIRMVSEGVDIPRLRVLVYATNVVTELFFRQAAGRIMRGDDTAYFFFPKDNRLCEFAEQIKAERNHQLEEELEELRKAAEREDGTLPESDYRALASEGIKDTVYFDGETLAPAELDEARQYAEANGGLQAWPDLQRVAILMRRMRGTASTAPLSQEDPLDERKRKAKSLCKRLVGQLVGMNGRTFTHKDVNAELARRQGSYIDGLELPQLVRRADILKEWIASGFQPTRE